MSPIRQVSHEAVRTHLQTNYNISVSRCEPTTTGLDNSVFFIYDSRNAARPKYVFKIIETRPTEAVMEGIRISLKLGEFTCIDYVRTLDGNIATQFDGCLAFVMIYIAGDKLEIRNKEDILNTARFLARFHRLHSKQGVGNSRREALAMLDGVNLYWNDKVQDHLAYHFPFRQRFYDRALTIVRGTARVHIEKLMGLWPSLYGIMHGDLNTENLINCPQSGLQLIDFDGSSETGFQLFDLLQLAAKSPIATNPSATDLFLKDYFESYNSGLVPPISHESICDSFQSWLLVFSLHAMLSTDYYTFEIGKFDVSWSQKYATQTLLRLQECCYRTSLRMKLSEPENKAFTDASKCLIAITGVTTSGKSTLAAALSAMLPDSTVLPIMTTRMPRSDDDARFVSCVKKDDFAATRHWVKRGSYGIPLAAAEKFFSGTSKIAICVCGPFEMIQLDSVCPSSVRVLRVLLRYALDIDTERKSLQEAVPYYFTGEMRQARLSIALEHTAKFFFDKDFLLNYIDVVLHREMHANDWTRIIVMYINCNQPKVSI